MRRTTASPPFRGCPWELHLSIYYIISHKDFVKLCEMFRKALDSIFLIYNLGKLWISREEISMLLRRNNKDSNRVIHVYDLNDHKSIIISTICNTEISSITLCDFRKAKLEEIELKTLSHIENITIDGGELLKIDALLDLADREDSAALLGA